MSEAGAVMIVSGNIRHSAGYDHFLPSASMGELACDGSWHRPVAVALIVNIASQILKQSFQIWP